MIIDSPGRYWEKVNKAGPVPEYAPTLGNCWDWTGALNRTGYGTFWSGKTDRKTLMAHRVGHYLATGDRAEGLDLDHLCRRPSCVNPDHLEPVPRSVNASRGRKSWDFTGRCPRGHDPSEAGSLVGADGRRRCRECIRQRARERYAARAGGGDDDMKRRWRQASERYRARNLEKVREGNRAAQAKRRARKEVRDE